MPSSEEIYQETGRDYYPRCPSEDRAEAAKGMIKRHGHPRFFELLDELAHIHEAKNAGYAGRFNKDPLANFRVAERLGMSAVLGCFARWADKVERAFNLIDSPQNEQVGESLKDTLIDLAAYSLIAVILLEEEERDR